MIEVYPQIDDNEKNERKRYIIMKKIYDCTLKAIAGVALKSTQKEVNSACTFIAYQPKMSSKIRELKGKK